MGTFLFTTGEREIMDGISMLLYPLSLVKIPVRYAVLVVGIIFRFLPLLLDEMCGIVKTQMVRGSFGKAKGLSKIKKLLPLFVPLMLQTFRKAEQLSDALTARYFK
jgi:energy-coupling factor transport system ATP-binding protein